MVTLGLDQALGTTGWSIFENNKLITYNSFSIPAYKSIEIRLGEIWNKLNELYRTYQFDYIFFEDIQQQKGNVSTYKKLAYVHAAILLWCYFNEVKYNILAPSHWRSILKDKYSYSFGKSRTEQKKKAQELVETLYNISVSEDVADGICINLAGIIESNQNKSAF